MDEIEKIIKEGSILKEKDAETKSLYSWLDNEKKKDFSDTQTKKQIFISEIKKGLGEKIKNSDHKPKEIKISFWSKVKRVFGYGDSKPI